jgi:Ca2+-transporting ATPase
MADKIAAHAWSIEQTAKELGTHLTNGLTSTEARARFEKHGPNELKEKPRPGFLSLLFDQFKDFLIIILIAAAVLSVLLGEWIDAIVILAIVVLNAIIGVVQDSKAEASLAALKKMSAPNARIIRDGQQQTIPARDLVVGDLVMVEAGNNMPADLRLVESGNLKSEEASLTGESVPVDKNAKVILEPDAPIGDRDNCAFSSMLITYGRGTGIVTQTRWIETTLTSQMELA